MPLDFSPDSFGNAPVAPARRARGQRSYLAGRAAEDAVCRRYLAAGYQLVATRKLCPEGEIDLLMRLGAELVGIVFGLVVGNIHAASLKIKLNRSLK